MRSQSRLILDEWRRRTLFSMPELAHLPVKEFHDDIARILSAMADALESNDPPELNRLVQVAPAHGFQRFLQEYDLAELFAEERVLRRVIVSRVEEALKRQCKADEAAALHALIDIMLQQGVLALVQQQKHQLRHSSEVQLKYLSFLSHDLSNNFLVITANLQFLEEQIAAVPQMRQSAEALGAALATIRRTRQGMRRLLQHEQLRGSEATPGASPVNLREVVEPIVALGAFDAQNKGVEVHNDIDPRATASTNADLLTIVLQNLIGNAVKHSMKDENEGKGEAKCRTVRIGAERRQADAKDSWILWVMDDGPGIPKDQVDRLFHAFERELEPGEGLFGEEGGFGLGLAIASQAARLLGTTIEVETQSGRGSKFSFVLRTGEAAKGK